MTGRNNAFIVAFMGRAMLSQLLLLNINEIAALFYINMMAQKHLSDSLIKQANSW